MIAFQRPEITFSARSAGNIGRRLIGSVILTSWSVLHELVGITFSPPYSTSAALEILTHQEARDESRSDQSLRRSGSPRSRRAANTDPQCRSITGSCSLDRRQPGR